MEGQEVAKKLLHMPLLIASLCLSNVPMQKPCGLAEVAPSPGKALKEAEMICVTSSNHLLTIRHT